MPNAAERARNAYLHRASRKRRHARVIQQMGGVCVRCGNIRDLQIHHKTKRFAGKNRCGDTNMADARRTPEEVELLCSLCHTGGFDPQSLMILKCWQMYACWEWEATLDRLERSGTTIASTDMRQNPTLKNNMSMVAYLDSIVPEIRMEEVK